MSTEKHGASPRRLERETDERDVHPEEEGRPGPHTSGEGTDEALAERAESGEGDG
ncbi:hypothetical protein [Streptomyces sp. NPDC047841]|uniref:hypothetical protein n=1 Tax=Streptomyces sp. NPDC047841 TaxID=3154708 RepID=UPI0034560FA3